MKTFDKQGRITKQAQKARYPKFIAYIDCNSTSETGVFTKAMIETDILEAMRTLEKAVSKKTEDVYLCGIYQNTGETNEAGEPLYEMVIGMRMAEKTFNVRYNWHFWDKEHDENQHPLSLWYSKDFGHDDIKEWDRNGKLQSRH